MTSRIQRTGDTARRPASFWTPAVHGLLSHLRAAGFPAPRPLGIEGETEILTWIDGESGPAGWAKIVPENGLRNWAAFLRRYDDAVAGYRPASGTLWSSGPGTCAPGEIICHGDFGPWNGVWNGEHPVGLIDFDHARPAPPIFDIAYALEYAAPFRDDFECLRWLRYPRPPDRRRRIEIFCDAYGIAVPGDITHSVARQQRLVLQTCQALASQDIEPQATWVRDGYLDTIRARINWTESFQAALTGQQNATYRSFRPQRRPSWVIVVSFWPT